MIYTFLEPPYYLLITMQIKRELHAENQVSTPTDKNTHFLVCFTENVLTHAISGCFSQPKSYFEEKTKLYKS